MRTFLNILTELKQQNDLIEKSKNKSKEKILAFFLESSSSSSLFYAIQRRKKREITQVINKTRKKQMGRKKLK